MSDKYFFASLSRISDLESRPFSVCPLPRYQWATGDYVVGEVIPPVYQSSSVELTNGRIAYLLEGDLIIGAFGIRRATLEAVGDWQSIESDDRMENMTTAGLFGRVTSKSFLLAPLTSLLYRGHVLRDGQKVCMKDFVSNLPVLPYNCPTILIVGTSMSAGKTTTARAIIHQLKRMDLKVVGAKLTGAGRYRDILSMGDAGADKIFDFVDVGLPSSIVPPEEFRVCVRKLLSAIATENPDVVVAEAGASPFEPYNGSVVLEELKEQIRCTVLCASDPYAVVGVSRSFGLTPDLISGIATSTTAGVELVEKLSGVKALTLSDRKSVPELTQILKVKLAL
ncbi:hypothetical protein NIES593_12780 [Hydrococcus rivularis NIES-593]|uniref:Uncharacterized protein n=1 Tax=Hydrococcus rivularis NIES-593 TaxID=1921803 RepID=A0A1U7HFK3_9CYAN|nr:DUF1611 domain-containing protein [Hydrococcus rivularis]OKH22344.1 hypothetical protein NIES593_12780 [Hydrococcus rivularis NIES-593]